MIVLAYGRDKVRNLQGKFLPYYVSFIYLSLISYIFNTLSDRIAFLPDNPSLRKLSAFSLHTGSVCTALRPDCLLMQRLERKNSPADLWGQIFRNRKIPLFSYWLYSCIPACRPHSLCRYKNLKLYPHERFVHFYIIPSPASDTFSCPLLPGRILSRCSAF